ncbi:alpha/beta hydrolase [Lacicoccus alkaliphilus]|uniref:Phospholipase/carboxylesterase n=1 Tax=Lacicoccus alkaliphilus DSM 16010 TaxID=1123231 RepID=A0A1M7IIA9_9BACL|nr:alpha/beta hydrolase [Salinicoccus alkaliphilus]SHM40167.1 phospholipase/carboxylesterase [Salinicoccus alkaliphilus DSM 16010]
MEHLFIKGKNESPYTIILLHGTGGRETDLLDVAATVDANANVLSFRGNVDENGRTRFFKRLSPKEVDEDNLAEEGRRLYDKLLECEKDYGFDLRKSIFIGYSNGANMAAHLLLNYDLYALGAMLLHSGYRSEQIKKVDLTRTNVLLTAGARDMVTTAGEAYQLKKAFELKGAIAEVKLTDGGHEIVPDELMEGHVWFLGLKREVEDEFGKLEG